MEIQLNIINQEIKKIGRKIHRGKKNTTNFGTNQKIEIYGIEIEKVDKYKYLGQTIAMEDRTSYEAQFRLHAGWSVFSRYSFTHLFEHFEQIT